MSVVKSPIKNIIQSERIEKNSIKININEYEHATFVISKQTNNKHIIYSLKNAIPKTLNSHILSVSDIDFTIYIENDTSEKREVEIDYMIF